MINSQTCSMSVMETLNGFHRFVIGYSLAKGTGIGKHIAVIISQWEGISGLFTFILMIRILKTIRLMFLFSMLLSVRILM